MLLPLELVFSCQVVTFPTWDLSVTVEQHPSFGNNSPVEMARSSPKKTGKTKKAASPSPQSPCFRKGKGDSGQWGQWGEVNSPQQEKGSVNLAVAVFWFSQEVWGEQIGQEGLEETRVGLHCWETEVSNSGGSWWPWLFMLSNNALTQCWSVTTIKCSHHSILRVPTMDGLQTFWWNTSPEHLENWKNYNALDDRNLGILTWFSVINSKNVCAKDVESDFVCC